MEIEGKLIEKMQAEQVSDKFRKQEFVVEYIKDNPQYPELISFQLVQGAVGLIDQYQIGQAVKVTFDLKGRKWEPNDGRPHRYFNTLQAWRIDLGGEIPGQLMAPPRPTQQSYAPTPQQYQHPQAYQQQVEAHQQHPQGYQQEHPQAAPQAPAAVGLMISAQPMAPGPAAPMPSPLPPFPAGAAPAPPGLPAPAPPGLPALAPPGMPPQQPAMPPPTGSADDIPF